MASKADGEIDVNSTTAFGVLIKPEPQEMEIINQMSS
jgi:hypothetical protein